MRQPRTTENLKDRLWESLFQLMEEKPYANISISEITQKADVGRATFYRHFESKDDLIIYAFRRILDRRPGHGGTWNTPKHEHAGRCSHEHAGEEGYGPQHAAGHYAERGAERIAGHGGSRTREEQREHVRTFAAEYFTTLSHYKHILRLTYEQKLDYLLFASVYRTASDNTELDVTGDRTHPHAGAQADTQAGAHGSAHRTQYDARHPRGHNAAARLPYIRAIHAASAFAILDQWISSDFHDTPETLAEILADIVFPPRRREER